MSKEAQTSLSQSVIDQMNGRPKIVIPTLQAEKTAPQKEQDSYNRLVSMYRQKGLKAQEIVDKLRAHPGAPPYIPPAPPEAKTGEKIVEVIVEKVREMTPDEMRERLAALEKTSPPAGEVVLTRAESDGIKASQAEGQTPAPPTALSSTPGPAIQVPAVMSGEAWDEPAAPAPSTAAAPAPAPATPKKGAGK